MRSVTYLRYLMFTLDEYTVRDLVDLTGMHVEGVRKAKDECLRLGLVEFAKFKKKDAGVRGVSPALYRPIIGRRLE